MAIGLSADGEEIVGVSLTTANIDLFRGPCWPTHQRPCGQVGGHERTFPKVGFDAQTFGERRSWEKNRWAGDSALAQHQRFFS